MTSTPPPARHQLWHPTRGISFSPTPRLYKSPPKEPSILTRKPATTTRQPAQPAAESAVETQDVSSSEAIDAQPDTVEARGQEGNGPEDGRWAVAEDDGETNAGADQKTDFGPPPATMNYEIVKDLFYAAKKARPGSPESYWSYTHYRGPVENGTPRKVTVHYCRSKHTMESVCQKYFMEEKVLGFDLEWVAHATRQDDIRKNVSLIQLASPSRIALFHVAVFDGKTGFVAPSFKQIMEDPGVTKVGVAIKGDATRVRNFMHVDSRGLLELSHLYKLVIYSSNRQYENINKRLVPLATQVEQFLRLPLFKGNDVRSKSIRIEDLGSSTERQEKKKSPSKRGRSKPPPKPKLPPKPKHPFVEAAEDRAMCYKEAHPSTRVTPTLLRAYYLWYNHDLHPKAIASMVREPPIQENSVRNYILTSIQYEKLPYNQERLLHELAYPLPYTVRSRWPVAIAAVKQAESKNKV
ncbi:hypothetical protein SLS62_000751 [Diatrype stigma]|uniref:3'-5' exonuclease domain-containing protein n=1 Tax=Diatrype stigma TaxID=117547 RepID=A0AAN9YWH7_9PEZI